MYFVTSKREGYILFAMTPSELAALGLTEKQEVHLLSRPNNTAAWTVTATWSAKDFSHTDFMTAWHQRQEPASAEGLLDVLPAAVARQKPV